MLEMKEIQTSSDTQNQEVSLAEIPLDRRGRIRWAFLRRENPSLFATYIQRKARQCLINEGSLTQGILKKLGGLDRVVDDYYEGGLNQLKIDLGVNSAQHPKGYWTPEKIKEEVLAIRQHVGRVTIKVLNECGASDLAYAISSNYPGAWTQLRADLELEVVSKPFGYWTTDIILKEAKSFLEVQGAISDVLARKFDRYDLSRAIQRHYPGGWRQLKQDLGLDQGRRIGFWTTETIEKEAGEFHRTQGELSQRALSESKRFDLINAINTYYPGGLKGLQERFGITSKQKPTGYWSPDVIEREAWEFYETYGNITQKLLGKHHRYDLHGGISHYPGGLFMLKEKLGIKQPQKQRNYWSKERIEQEVKTFYAQYGNISNAFLIKQGRSDLASAIYDHFPGGISVLKDKLAEMGVMGKNLENSLLISSEEANEELRRLLEE